MSNLVQLLIAAVLCNPGMTENSETAAETVILCEIEETTTEAAYKFPTGDTEENEDYVMFYWNQAPQV